MSPSKLLSFTLAASLCLAFVPRSAVAQIVIDWPTKKLVSYPQIVNQQVTTAVVVNDVNDILYQYKIVVIGAPRALDDASSLFAIGQQAAGAVDTAKAAGAPVGGLSNCAAGAQMLDQNVADIGKAVAAIVASSSKKDAQGNPVSIPLAQTISDWNNTVRPLLLKIKGPPETQGSMAYVALKCTGPEKTNLGDPAYARAQAVLPNLESLQRKVDGPHQIQQSTSLSASTDYTVTVTETDPTSGATTNTLTQTFSPASTLLTLSLGTLLSGIEQRSYTNVKDPSNTAQNLLSVNGRGRYSPLGTGLLNYEVISNKTGNVGLTASSGLVVAFGASKVTASSLGFFGGASLHLYHRLFISAGAHIGQFSDFPPGLVRGSVVPANFGDLTGVNRTTARFAFGVTYQTKSFTSSAQPAATNSMSGGSTTAAGAKKTGAAAPAPAPAGK